VPLATVAAGELPDLIDAGLLDATEGEAIARAPTTSPPATRSPTRWCSSSRPRMSPRSWRGSDQTNPNPGSCSTAKPSPC